MSVISAAVPFFPMARKDNTPKKDQINFRLTSALIERMERYRDKHPLRPTATQIVEAAIADWLDAHEIELASRAKSKKHP